MKNRHSYFRNVHQYYSDLCSRLPSAVDSISMVCLAFEDGYWAQKLIKILCNCASKGVKVRLMVDSLGQLTDEPRRPLRNYRILKDLKKGGVDVTLFHPNAPGLTAQNRMHCKFCAVDQSTVYLGGSNIGDYYTTWSDSNLRVDGNLGMTMHEVFDYLRAFSRNKEKEFHLDLGKLWIGDDRLLLTIPGQRLDIRRALLDLIREADRAIYLRTWYFLPDKEILAHLCNQAKNKVAVNLLLSSRTRIRLVDAANHIHVHRLSCAGGKVYRYTDGYMHAKAEWNNRGTVLFGSANMDQHSMSGNFESCLLIHDHSLARELQKAFQLDLNRCAEQSPEGFLKRSVTNRIISHACNLAAPWL